MATLNHPHIVRYHTAWVDTCLDDYCIDEEVWDDSHEDENEDDYEEAEDKGKVICIQMELYPSGLDIVLKPAEYVYEEDRALSYFRRIMQALDHLHELGVVHRDLQPANILLDRDDRIKIADFGLAKYLNNLEGEANHSLCQTIRPYDAPEMSNRDNLTNEKVDIFSMGIIWFELCHPFGTEAERCHYITKLKGGELDTNWLDNFVKKSWLVRRMIAKEPSERPSARDVLEMLDGA